MKKRSALGTFLIATIIAAEMIVVMILYMSW